MQSTPFDFRKFLDDFPAEKSAAPRQRSHPQSDDPALSVTEFERYAAWYLEDCECAGQSPATISGKKDVVAKLLWFLRRENADVCSVAELRRFIMYLQKGHLEPGGRWGNKTLVKPVGQRTVRYYYVYLQGLFGWFVKQGVLSASPLALMRRPDIPEGEDDDDTSDSKFRRQFSCG
jgi:hypothetical protein